MSMIDLMSTLIQQSTLERRTLLTAREAADRLGIKLDTLYAYVSRGRLRSVILPGIRERRYRVEDVEALLDARSGAKQPQNTDPEGLMPAIEQVTGRVPPGISGEPHPDE